MRLRIKGPVVLTVILALLLLIGGGMIFKLKYEDSKDQQAWDDFREVDLVKAEKAALAMPLVEKYEILCEQYPAGSAEIEQLAKEITGLFPEFKAPQGGGPRLLPARKMKTMLTHYMNLG
jgi:hypothetical protein